MTYPPVPSPEGRPRDTTGAPYGSAPTEVCAFHPGRATALHCTRCNRPACPACLTPASVGFHCQACVAEARGSQRVPRSVAGSRLDQQPFVTIVLIAVNVLIFVIGAVQARDVIAVDGSRLNMLGALFPAMVAQGEWWRVITSGFLHQGLIHIALNMISLYMLGLPLERLIGRLRFAAVYGVSLLGGSAAVMLFAAPVSLSVGASGAIFGLMGALVVTFRRMKFDLRQLALLIAVNLFITFRVAGISWQAHLGGLVVGALVGAAMVYPPARTRKAWQLGGVIGLVVLLAVVIVVRSAAIGDVGCELRTDGFYCPPTA